MSTIMIASPDNLFGAVYAERMERAQKLRSIECFPPDPACSREPANDLEVAVRDKRRAYFKRHGCYPPIRWQLPDA